MLSSCCPVACLEVASEAPQNFSGKRMGQVWGRGRGKVPTLPPPAPRSCSQDPNLPALLYPHTFRVPPHQGQGGSPEKDEGSKASPATHPSPLSPVEGERVLELKKEPACE